MYFLISLYFLLPRGARRWAHLVQFSQQALLRRGIVELLLTPDNADAVARGHIKGGMNLDLF